MAIIKKLYFLPLMFSWFYSCSIKDIESSGVLVPPTAAEDSLLPQYTITVNGHTRKLHLQSFGNPDNPPLFVLPGGPGADFRLLLPLRELADSFYVVFWDPRGAGLSERVSKEELSFESFIDEIREVKKGFSPAKPINLVGHSYGGLFATRFAGEFPNEVDHLILIEPGQMKPSEKTGYKGGAVSFLDGQSFFWSNEILTSYDHNTADYKAIDILPKASRNFTCDRSIISNYPMWRFGTYHYHIISKNARQLPGEYLWSAGIENFRGRITIIAGTCGAASKTFQEKYVLPYFNGADLKTISGGGHLSLFTEYANQVIKEIRFALH